MEKPVLVVMAAGMGSRYGGLKQIDPVGPHGQSILDYSVYDAKQAGFETVVFVIKKDMEEAFREKVGNRIAREMHVLYAFQEMDDLPDGYQVPEGRVKPWGTCHAVLAARKLVKGPFAVINADDCYGPEAFCEIYQFLANQTEPTDGLPAYAMVGYLLCNTVTENGSVSRGICKEDENHLLLEVTERTCIEKTPDGIRYTEDGGQTYFPLDANTIVSMNMWGFTAGFFEEAESRFSAFLDQVLQTNPLKGENYLPSVVSELIAENKVRVFVLKSHDKWYGVTYREDKPVVTDALAKRTAEGFYPEVLWEAE